MIVFGVCLLKIHIASVGLLASERVSEHIHTPMMKRDDKNSKWRWKHWTLFRNMQHTNIHSHMLVLARHTPSQNTRIYHSSSKKWKPWFRWCTMHERKFTLRLSFFLSLRTKVKNSLKILRRKKKHTQPTKHRAHFYKANHKKAR